MKKKNSQKQLFDSLLSPSSLNTPLTTHMPSVYSWAKKLSWISILLFFCICKTLKKKFANSVLSWHGVELKYLPVY